MNYSPELTGIGRYTGEMAEWLVSKGHYVAVICAPPYYPDWNVFNGYSSWKYKREMINGVNVIRCPLWVPNKPSGSKRILHLISYAMSSFFVTLLECMKKPDVVITIEPPILSAPVALFGAKISGAKSVMHIQDLEIDAAVATGQVKANRLVKMALVIERYLLNRFSIVSTISHSMINRLKSKGVNNDSIVYFPNWVDTKKIKPEKTKSTYREILNIRDNTFVVLYSGNIGRKQGLDILLEAAKKLKQYKKILFVVSGEGVGKDEFVAKADQLNNVMCLPLQPEDELSEFLNLADVHVLPMLEGTDELVMPSKLGNMLSSGRPVIVTANEHSEIASFVKGAGIIVPFGDVDKIVESIELLENRPEMKNEFGEQARRTAITNLEKEVVLSRAETALRNL
jgi:colanic acid biosynthesis glycosyl transferase WcaI